MKMLLILTVAFTMYACMETSTGSSSTDSNSINKEVVEDAITNTADSLLDDSSIAGPPPEECLKETDKKLIEKFFKEFRQAYERDSTSVYSFLTPDFAKEAKDDFPWALLSTAFKHKAQSIIQLEEIEPGCYKGVINLNDEGNGKDSNGEEYHYETDTIIEVLIYKGKLKISSLISAG